MDAERKPPGMGSRRVPAKPNRGCNRRLTVEPMLHSGLTIVPTARPSSCSSEVTAVAQSLYGHDDVRALSEYGSRCWAATELSLFNARQLPCMPLLLLNIHTTQNLNALRLRAAGAVHGFG